MFHPFPTAAAGGRLVYGYFGICCPGWRQQGKAKCRTQKKSLHSFIFSSSAVDGKPIHLQFQSLTNVPVLKYWGKALYIQQIGWCWRWGSNPHDQ